MKHSAPARIDLAGGTLDIPPICYFIKDTLTLNLTINLRVSVEIKQGNGFVLNQDQKTHVDELPLFKLALDYFGLEPKYDFIVENAIPRASGLGGSSTLLVALVKCLSEIAGKTLGNDTLLNAVTVLENRLLGKPAGTQDGAAAIYGGLSRIEFEQGPPRQSALRLPEYLSGELYLVYCAEQHHSGINNWSLIKSACEGDTRTLDVFRRLNENAHKMQELLQSGSAEDFLVGLRKEVALREELCSDLMTPDMASFANGLSSDYVAKVCGAGGGGCMFVFAVSPDAGFLKRTAEQFGLALIEVKADPQGCVAS